MNISKIALALCVTGSLAACGSGAVSKDQARAGYILATGLSQAVVPVARSHAGSGLRSEESIQGICQGGGDISFSGTGSASGLDFTFAFNNCSFGGATLDGSWHITGNATTATVKGNLSLSGGNFGFACDFDISVTGAGAATGTACGYNVADLNG